VYEPRGARPAPLRGDPHAPEAGGEVHGHVLVALLEAVVLADVVQVVPTDDDGALHLHLGHHAWAAEEGGRESHARQHAPTLGNRGWRFWGSAGTNGDF